MNAIFRVTLLEIFASTGWVVLCAATVVLYFATPIVAGAYGEGIVVSRGQGAVGGLVLSGLYCVMVAGRVGAAQVSRGANMYYRAFGIGEASRWAGVAMACFSPLLAVGAVSGVLLLWNYLTWSGDAMEGAMAILQFFALGGVMIFSAIAFTVGVGAKFGYGPGVLGGVGLLAVGNLFPQLLSLAVGGVPWLETVWAFLPHLYALDWSPSVIYLWKAAGWGDFLLALFYGVGWMLVLGGFGLFFFSRSANQHE